MGSKESEDTIQEESAAMAEPAETRDPAILTAIQRALGEFATSEWDPVRQQPILVDGMYEKLVEVHANHQGWQVTGDEAISELELARDPEAAELGINVDVFANEKRALMKAGVKRTSMTLVFRVFDESLIILRSGHTTRELAKKQKRSTKPQYTNIPISASKSERSGLWNHSRFNKDAAGIFKPPTRREN